MKSFYFWNSNYFKIIYQIMRLFLRLGVLGYVPGAKPDNALGETFTTISRRCFTRERLDTKPN